MYRLSIVLIVSLLACKQKSTEAVPAQKVEPISVVKMSSERHTKYPAGTKYDAQGFWEYLPKGYTSKKQYPLLIFLHGFGENGDGSTEALDKLMVHGPPKHIMKDDWPLHKGDDFIVLSVQNHREHCHESQDIDAFLKWAVSHYQVDQSRVYLTGLSCGGYGVWDYLNNNPDNHLLAAAVPICGDGSSVIVSAGCKLATFPIWAFHGDSDAVVDVSGTNKPMNFLMSCDEYNGNMKKTIYPGVNHDSWSQSYDKSEHDIYSWLLSYRKNKK